MGHARCEKLMGFNMGLARRVCGEAAEKRDGWMQVTRFVKKRWKDVSSEIEICRVWETFTQTFQGTEYSF
jgi:hypothetical protein